MKKTLLLISLLVAALLTGSCVHEFPELFPNEMQLTLKFDMDLDFYREYVVDTRAEDAGLYRMRYVVKGYALRNDGTTASEAAFTHVWFADNLENPDITVDFDIPSGQWRIAAWSDIVPAGAEEEFYDAADFNAVTYKLPYVGNTDLRDAFRGTVDFLAEPENFAGNSYEATIDMTRPLAKYIFISTDLTEFINQFVRTQNAGGARITAEDVDLSQFRVVFFYSGYMPNTYNLLLDRPVGSATGIRFEGSMIPDNEGNVYLGFDYTMVRTTESSVQVTVGIYDREGNQLSMSPAVEVPLMRSKYTIVKGKFLVRGSSNGIAINPDFDGEFNIIITD